MDFVDSFLIPIQQQSICSCNTHVICDLHCWLQFPKKWNALYFNGVFMIKEYMPVKLESFKE